MLSAARVVPWAGHVYRSGALRSNTTVHASAIRFALIQRRALSTVADEDRSGGENGEGRENSSRQRRRPTPLLGRGVGLLGILLLGEMTGADVRCAPVAPSDDSKASTWISRFFGVSPPTQSGDAAENAAPPPAVSRDADPARAGSSAAPPPPSGAATDAAAAAFDAALSRINVEELGLQVWRCDTVNTVVLHVIAIVVLQLTLGGVAGFCSGYALKKVSKAAAIAVGVGFVALQLLRYNGLISDVDWGHVEETLVRVLDTDGDGKITINDVRTHLVRTVRILGFNIPSGAAFGGAFVLGLRYG